jgi:PhnB protein
MGAIDQALQPGETVRHRARISRFIYLSVLIPYAVLAVLALPVIWVAQLLPDPAGVVLSIPLLLSGFTAIVTLMSLWSQRSTTVIVVTDRRVICKEGFMAQRMLEIRLDKIESIEVRQSMLGRMFNYGNIVIQGYEHIGYVDAPIDMRDQIVEGRQASTAARLQSAFRPKEQAMATQISPMLTVSDGVQAIKFYKNAFGAAELWRIEAGGHVVAGLSINGAQLFLASESPGHGTRSPDLVGHTTVRIELFVDDPYEAQNRALAAGATEANPIREHSYPMSGPRPINRMLQGVVVDPFGHRWLIGKVLE